MLNATIPVASLKSVLGVIASVNDEAVLKISPGGISSVVVDPANAAMTYIEPNMCWIVKLVDYADSLHIYESDRDAADAVKIVPVMRGV